MSCTWPTISGMPRARSISCKAMTSAVLSRESSWSRSARSSLGPSLLARGPSSSSRGCPNWSLTREMIWVMLSHFMKRRRQSQKLLMTASKFTSRPTKLEKRQRHRVGTSAKGLPLCVTLWSVHSHGRLGPGGGLRWGPMSTKPAHTQIGFIGTCRGDNG